MGLGVLMNKDNKVRCAGGFIIQLMPFAEEDVITKLEENIKGLPSVTTMLDEGKDPEEILRTVLNGLDLQVTDQSPVSFQCDCSKERVERALISIGRTELQDMIDEGKEVEVNCQFCGKHYQFSPDELRALHARATRD